ncbi:MAG TPA: response regulator [Gemmatimonadales bacterium]|nr:response regulator [Gemmatimonadales bacterium]
MRSYTILMIEDSQTYTVLATNILTTMGHHVTVAGSAEQGIEIARDLVPTVILMDIHLPGMNGYEAVRKIRSDPELRYVPVIAMTVTEPVSKAAIEMGIEAGFTGHTQKPIHEAGFKFVLETYLEG